MSTVGSRHFGRAWFLLTLALAAHVTDEALTDFLAVYNPTAAAIRARTGIPLPTFTFETWLTGLIVAVLLLLALTPLARRGASGLVPLAWLYGAIMLANGLGHIAGSFYMRRPMPGVWSAPLLLAASAYLLWSLRQRGRPAGAGG